MGCRRPRESLCSTTLRRLRLTSGRLRKCNRLLICSRFQLWLFDAIIADGEQITRVWAENPSFTLGEITLPILQSKITSLRQKRDQVESLRTQMTALTNDLSAQSAEMTSINRRARSGFRAVFGPDSSQYEQVGGTRSSERRRRSSKKSAPLPDAQSFESRRLRHLERSAPVSSKARFSIFIARL